MLQDLLQRAVKEIVSDIHITVNDNVAFRKSQSIVKQKEILNREEVLKIAKELSGDRFSELEQVKQLDLGGSIYGVRYRANIYLERGNIAVAIRVINNKVKSIVELGLPYTLFELIKKPHGLILITGPTGSGKSTTLAAMINEINKDFEKHIITIEDPIEYVFGNQKSIIHQRELGNDLNSFDDGLKSVLRQDPDVIMIGELRDKLSVRTALKASETGHLVISTLHTANVKSTLNRITGIFSNEEAQTIRQLLSESLVAIISQRLIKRADNEGVVPAFEILINTTATANIIRKGEVGQIDSYLMMDQKLGSVPMEKSLEQLIKRGIIEKE